MSNVYTSLIFKFCLNYNLITCLKKMNEIEILIKSM